LSDQPTADELDALAESMGSEDIRNTVVRSTTMRMARTTEEERAVVDAIYLTQQLAFRLADALEDGRVLPPLPEDREARWSNPLWKRVHNAMLDGIELSDALGRAEDWRQFATDAVLDALSGEGT